MKLEFGRFYESNGSEGRRTLSYDESKRTIVLCPHCEGKGYALVEQDVHPKDEPWNKMMACGSCKTTGRLIRDATVVYMAYEPPTTS